MTIAPFQGTCCALPIDVNLTANPPSQRNLVDAGGTSKVVTLSA